MFELCIWKYYNAQRSALVYALCNGFFVLGAILRDIERVWHQRAGTTGGDSAAELDASLPILHLALNLFLWPSFLYFGEFGPAMFARFRANLRGWRQVWRHISMYKRKFDMTRLGVPPKFKKHVSSSFPIGLVFREFPVKNSHKYGLTFHTSAAIFTS